MCLNPSAPFPNSLTFRTLLKIFMFAKVLNMLKNENILLNPKRLDREDSKLKGLLQTNAITLAN